MGLLTRDKVPRPRGKRHYRITVNAAASHEVDVAADSPEEAMEVAKDAVQCGLAPGETTAIYSMAAEQIVPKPSIDLTEDWEDAVWEEDYPTLQPKGGT